jgi:hypothetical protein
MAPPKINSFSFGYIIIDGSAHERDVIILPDRVLGRWWRQEGHVLHPADITPVLDAKPDILVIGQGTSRRMRITAQAQAALRDANIELIALPTDEACQTYNNMREQRITAAALHLTC